MMIVLATATPKRMPRVDHGAAEEHRERVAEQRGAHDEQRPAQHDARAPGPSTAGDDVELARGRERADRQPEECLHDQRRRPRR